MQTNAGESHKTYTMKLMLTEGELDQLLRARDALNESAINVYAPVVNLITSIQETARVLDRQPD